MKMSKDRCHRRRPRDRADRRRRAGVAGPARSSGSEGGAIAATPPPAAAPRPLALSAAAQVKNPVKVAPAELAKLAGDIQVVGTVAFHEDHFAVVGPLVPGRISKLVAGVGDKVKRGQVIAEIESSEVGQARAEFVSAKARFAAADSNLKRESDLAEKKISSSRERELAHAQWVTEQAGVRAAVMRLRAIGLSPADIEEAEKHDLGGRVQMRAPIGGTVIERKVTLGQAVERATDAFKIADTIARLGAASTSTRRTWRAFTSARRSRCGPTRCRARCSAARVAFIVPVIDEATRTAKVRLEFPNPNGQPARRASWSRRASSAIRSWRTDEVLAVPRSAVEQVEGKTVGLREGRARPSSGATCVLGTLGR